MKSNDCSHKKAPKVNKNNLDIEVYNLFTDVTSPTILPTTNQALISKSHSH